MQREYADAPGAEVAGSSRITRFLDAIGYPIRAPAGAFAFTLLVDGAEMTVRDTGRNLRLECRLTDDASELPRLASYAAGRMLREDAVLAFGTADGGAGGGRASDAAFLWREAPAGADAAELQRIFESFANSCDWWRERISESSKDEGSAPFPEMMIRP